MRKEVRARKNPHAAARHPGDAFRYANEFFRIARLGLLIRLRRWQRALAHETATSG